MQYLLATYQEEWVDDSQPGDEAGEGRGQPWVTLPLQHHEDDQVAWDYEDYLIELSTARNIEMAPYFSLLKMPNSSIAKNP